MNSCGSSGAPSCLASCESSLGFFRAPFDFRCGSLPFVLLKSSTGAISGVSEGAALSLGLAKGVGAEAVGFFGLPAGAAGGLASEMDLRGPPSSMTRSSPNGSHISYASSISLSAFGVTASRLSAATVALSGPPAFLPAPSDDERRSQDLERGKPPLLSSRHQ